MKNVVLIGDSIRMGYDKAVKKSLEGKANVFFPEKNCSFAAYILRYMHEYRALVENADVDVVHWNAGLHDCLRMYEEDPQTPIDIYAYYIDRICVRMKKLFPNAKIIFATSTKVETEKMSKGFMRDNAEIVQYNAAAVEIVKKHGFIVNDLFAVSETLPEEAHSDNVHYYTPMATEKFTNAVLSHLLPALGIDEKIVYKEEIYTDAPSW